MSTNQVRILVYDERDQPINLFGLLGRSKWKIAFGTPVVSEGHADPGDPLPAWDWSSTPNQIEIIFSAGRHRTEPVAVSYVNAGYGANIGEWPDAPVPVNATGQSANMSVHGEFAVPQEMNFYFPLTITTPAGFVMNLLLGQTGTSSGFGQLFKDLAEEAMDVFESSLEAEEGDEPNAAEEALDAAETAATITKDLIDLFGSNPWYVTVIGTTQSPAAMIPTIPIVNRDCVGLLCAGSTTTGGKQAALFFHDSSDSQGDYTFKLKIYDERLPGTAA